VWIYFSIGINRIEDMVRERVGIRVSEEGGGKDLGKAT